MDTLRRHATGYNFIGDPDTGVTVRWGRNLTDDPARAPWPELVDISISNHLPVRWVDGSSVRPLLHQFVKPNKPKRKNV